MKKSLIYFFCLFICHVYAFQDTPVTQVNDTESFQTFIAYYKELTKKENVEKLTSKSNKKLLDESILWAGSKGTEEQLLIAKILEVDYCNKVKNDIEVITKSNDLLKNTNVREVKDVVYMMQDLNLAYERTEQYAKLLEGYLLYYELLENHQVPSRKSSKNRRIANAYYKLKNYPKAIQFFKEAAYHYNKAENILMYSGAANDIGLSYLKLNQLDSAKVYFNQAKSIIGNRNESFKKVVEANIASIWVLEGDYSKALPFFLNELKYGKLPEVRMYAYYKIANVYYLMDEPSKSLKYLDSTFTELSSVQNGDLQSKALLLKAKSLLKASKFKEADVYFKKAEKYKDSLDIIEQEKKYTLAAVKYETSKRELELKESNQKIATDKKIQTYQQIGIALLAIGLIASFFVIRKTFRDKKIIQQQKVLAEKTSKEKEILLQEVHHRVKNNLQVISSILELQASKFQDEELADVFNVGQNRIQAMSLIHQQLYKSKNIKEIDFKEYISTLIDHIKVVNSEIVCPIHFDIETEHHLFPINTSVPLGLIVNELITNAYKHAFVNKHEGNIQVKLTKIGVHQFELIVADDGVGFSESLEEVDSLGLKLTHILSNQLGGEMTYTSNQGSQFRIIFKDNIAV